MMKKLSIIIFVLLVTTQVYSAPRLFFSDMTDGPVSGWEGSTTQGAAVSIWGLGFGSSGSVNIGGQAIPSTSCAEWAATSNPTTARGLQRITFYLNSSMSLGAQTITVTSGGETSSEAIPFYTRNTGNIYFVDGANGNDSNDGLQDTDLGGGSGPWATFGKARATVVAGDTVYIRTHTYTTADDAYVATGVYSVLNLRTSGSTSNHNNGTVNNSIAFAAYPGEVPQLCSGSNDGGEANVGITRHSNGTIDDLTYWTFSKLKVKAYRYGMFWTNGNTTWDSHLRIVGWDLTTTYAALGVGMGIMAAGDKEYTYILGNYMHHVGKALETDPHGYKVEPIYWQGFGDSDYTYIGYNEMYDNNGTLQVYGHLTTDNIDHIYIHNNLINGSGTTGIVVGGGDASPNHAVLGDAYIYNNIIANCQSSAMKLGDGSYGSYGGNAYVFNNTIYNNMLDIGSGDIYTKGNLDSVAFKNNITYSIGSSVYISETTADYSNWSGDHNIWYGHGAGPSWSTTGDLDNTDPLLSDPSNGDFNPASGSSPGVGAGSALSAVSSLFTTDYYGETLSDPVDIGAIQYASSGTITCYLDADGDLYSDGTSESVETCSTNYYESGDLTAITGDCNDSDASINPGATEICSNSIDDNCNGQTDENCTEPLTSGCSSTSISN